MSTVKGEGDKDHSRVVLVVGPQETVSREAMDKVMADNFVYNLDEVIDHGVVDGLARLEYRFGSYSCQANFARKAIAANFGPEVITEYGAYDPCQFSL